MKHDLTVYTARYLCMDETSNCDDVHLGGAEGTIIKLPEECGYATYGVVHEIKPSEDTAIPHHIRRRAPTHSVVHEVTFSYDFKRVKRDEGSDPIYVRIDYGSQTTWLTEAVDSAPNRKRDDASTLQERFWSTNESRWAEKIATTRASTNQEENKLVPIAANFSQLVYHQVADACNSGTTQKRATSDGFLSVSLDVFALTNLRWGYSLVGTISPTLKIEEAHGFFDSHLTSTNQLRVEGSGILAFPSGTPRVPVFSSAITDFNWSHPGIVEFSPRLNIDVELLPGGGVFDGDFKVNFATVPGSDGIIQTNSPNVGDFRGSIGQQNIGNGFNGTVSAASNGQSGSDRVVFGIRVTSQSWMDISVFGSGGVKGVGNFSVEVPHDILVKSDGDKVSIVNGYPSIVAEVYSTNISPSWETDNAAHLLDPQIKPFALFEGNNSQKPEPRAPPNTEGNALISGNFVSCNGDGNGNRTSLLVCLQLQDLVARDPDLLNDEDGENDASLHAPARRYILDAFGYATKTEPDDLPLQPRATGTHLLAVNPQAGRYSLEDPSDCENSQITAQGNPRSSYAAEHITELNTYPSAWSFMLRGFAPQTSMAVQYDSAFRAETIPLADFMGSTGIFRDAWSTWDSTGTHADPNTSPERAIWDALGSIDNPEVLVNAESVLNGFKSRMWRAVNGIGNDRWDANEWDDTTEISGVIRANEAISELRLYPAVIAYLNAPAVNQILVTTANRINEIYQEFDAAVLRARGVRINSALLWREYYHNVVLRRLQGSQGRYRELLWRLIDIWEAVQRANSHQPGTPYYQNILAILQALRGMRDAFDPVRGDPFKVNTENLFENPAPDQ
ncbi:hypothetical protein GQ53DRAFT_821349 [Thozetella sp. PMI_491]|nr:hypothetical protein GQ53DRAFT_821349 [Thozetella sp. PMI_491]